MFAPAIAFGEGRGRWGPRARAGRSLHPNGAESDLEAQAVPLGADPIQLPHPTCPNRPTPRSVHAVWGGGISKVAYEDFPSGLSQAHTRPRPRLDHAAWRGPSVVLAFGGQRDCWLTKPGWAHILPPPPPNRTHDNSWRSMDRWTCPVRSSKPLAGKTNGTMDRRGPAGEEGSTSGRLHPMPSRRGGGGSKRCEWGP